MIIQFNCKECGQLVKMVSITAIKPQLSMVNTLAVLKQQLCNNCIYERERQIRDIMQHREGYSFVAIDEMEK